MTPGSKHDISRVRHITGRSGNISPDRLRVEKLIEAAGTTPITQPTMAAELKLSADKVAGIMQRLRSDGLAVPVGRSGMHCLYVWHTHVATYRANTGRPIQPTQHRPDPIRNSNQPNGSTGYWTEHIRKMMTPARLEVQG